MARIRTVKPELFRHEDLFEAEIDTGLPLRLAFIGLFCCCDREGRFTWKPRQLKLDVLPWDETDFSRVLDALATRGFVQRYSVDGVDYGCIPSFTRHQVINNRESASSIPEPPAFTGIPAVNIDSDAELSTRESRVTDASATRHGNYQGEGKGKEGKGKEILGSSPKSGDNPSGKTKPDYPPEFEQLWQAKPEREGGNSKQEAFKAYCARLNAGVNHADMAAGLTRYRAYCEARDMIGSRMVKQLATFLGPNEHWLESYDLTDNSYRQSAGHGEPDWDVPMFDSQNYGQGEQPRDDTSQIQFIEGELA